MNSIFILLVMIVYFTIIIAVGILYSKKSSNTASDYFIGGRKLGPLVTAMSAEASDMSGYLLMGLPGLAYFSGLCDVGFTAIGLAIGTYLNWLFVAKRLRNYSQVANNAITLPEFISNRFHDDKSLLKIIAALFILIFFVVYVASCFVTFGKLFSLVFSFPYKTAMIIGAIIVLVYTLTGGFLAVCTTDLIQAIVMIFALFVVLIFGVTSAGGVSNVINNLNTIPGFLSFSLTANPTSTPGVFSEPSTYGFLTIISTMAWGLGYFGMPQVLIRFFAIRDAKEIKTSRRIATIWVVLSMCMAIFIGLVGRALYTNDPTLLTSSQSETIFIKLSQLLPALLSGLCLSGILAATMSSADSYLLITASSLIQDLYKVCINKNASEKRIVFLSKLVLIFVSIFSIFIALDENSVIFQVVSFAWAGFGATFGPLVLFSLFWKRTTKEAALSGMLSGGITVFIWKLIVRVYAVNNNIPQLNIYELLPAFIVSSIFIIIVSLSTKKPSDIIQSEFDKVATM